MLNSVSLTFPDGSVRDYDAAMTGAGLAESISKSLAKKAVAYAHRRHGARPLRPARQVRQGRDHHPRRSARAGADPPRRRPCAGGSRAGTVAGDAGDHRAGDRERVLLRFRPQRAVHARRFSGDREEDARDHRAQQAVHQGGLVARQGEEGLRRQGRALQAGADRRHSRGPGSQDLCAGRLVRPLPWPAHGLDRPDRQRLQADEGGRRLLARRLATTRC